MLLLFGHHHVNTSKNWLVGSNASLMIFDKNKIQIVPVGQPFLYAYIYGVPGLPDPMHRIAYLKVHRKYHLLHPLQSIQLSWCMD